MIVKNAKMNRAVLLLAIVLVVAFIGMSAIAQEAVPTDENEREQLRRELAQRYKNAEPGESFLVGHITFHLSQEYAMMVYQSIEQACRQLGLKFKGALAQSDAEWIQQTQSLIAAGAKAIIYNCPSVSVIPELAKICNENKVFMATYFGYTGEIFPGDFGPYWVLDNTPLSDEQTYFPLTILLQKMKENGRTKLLHIQASKTNATISTAYINLGVYMAWKNYPEILLLGHQFGEWNYEGGRKAAEAALAIRQDYEGLWGCNDSVTMGALRALEDRGLKLGPFTASRDMEMTTAEEILAGNFLVTCGFDIPYFGGRLVPMLYDMCVGEWYPLPDEVMQAPKLTTYGRPGEVEKLAEAAGLMEHPNFKLGPTEENLEKILKEMKKRQPNYPYDFRLASLAKCKELGLTYDRHAGGDLNLGQNDYYFPARIKKFGSMEAFKAHIAAVMEHFLDFSWADTWEQAEEYSKRFPATLKLDPVWED
jgi:ribose transport system substrate-binding protein